MSRWNHHFLFKFNPLEVFLYLQIQEDGCAILAPLLQRFCTSVKYNLEPSRPHKPLGNLFFSYSDAAHLSGRLTPLHKEFWMQHYLSILLNREFGDSRCLSCTRYLKVLGKQNLANVWKNTLKIAYPLQKVKLESSSVAGGVRFSSNNADPSSYWLKCRVN